jgi:hypothetical protein
MKRKFKPKPQQLEMSRPQPHYLWMRVISSADCIDDVQSRHHNHKQKVCGTGLWDCLHKYRHQGAEKKWIEIDNNCTDTHEPQ